MYNSIANRHIAYDCIRRKIYRLTSLKDENREKITDIGAIRIISRTTSGWPNSIIWESDPYSIFTGADQTPFDLQFRISIPKSIYISLLSMYLLKSGLGYKLREEGHAKIIQCESFSRIKSVTGKSGRCNCCSWATTLSNYRCRKGFSSPLIGSS